MKVYKCTYKQCKFGNEVEEDKAVKYNNRYYHKECLQESQNKNEIRKLFLEKINPTEVVSALNSTINNIINKKNVSSDFLLYALKYVIQYKIPLNHAAGLHYIINNDKIIESYDKIQTQKIREKFSYYIPKTEVSFNWQNDDTNSWNRILQR